MASHLISKAGLTRAVAKTGVVILIERLESALNLNIHSRMLVADGVKVTAQDTLCCLPVKPPPTSKLGRLAQQISQRVRRDLERRLSTSIKSKGASTTVLRHWVPFED